MTDDELCKNEFEKWFLLDEAVSDKHIKWCAWKTAWEIKSIPQPEAANVALDADNQAAFDNDTNVVSKFAHPIDKAAEIAEAYKLIENAIGYLPQWPNDAITDLNKAMEILKRKPDISLGGYGQKTRDAVEWAINEQSKYIYGQAPDELETIITALQTPASDGVLDEDVERCVARVIAAVKNNVSTSIRNDVLNDLETIKRAIKQSTAKDGV